MTGQAPDRAIKLMSRRVRPHFREGRSWGWASTLRHGRALCGRSLGSEYHPYRTCPNLCVCIRRKWRATGPAKPGAA